ncbi:TauD/TfdA dioxygenase family protein [Embleya sp. NPDC020886]|uniref:TauD/TfdA dioxygenase family protein n=1 Tax=Embleya sp. NPDC020886 TaxID=3363980 RepID=UPI00378D00AA
MFDIRPLTPTIGAEVLDLDLNRDDLDASVFAALTDALHERQVLFFRDQRITAHRQREVAARFGTLQHFPFGDPAAPDLPEVMVLATGGDGPKVSNADIWHSDATFMARPPLGTMLRAVSLPALGGDTVWADMESAYSGLSAPIRALLDGLTAEHDFAKSRSHRGGDRAALPPVVHPVVRTHPVTGRRCLYVNRIFTTRIVELDERENELLLPFLFDRTARPEFQVRLTWRPGDIALWDNRSTQHYAAYDYQGPRVMHRIVIEGDEPR